MLPSVSRLLIQVALPPVTVSAEPFATGWLNNVNLSPTANVGPRLTTVSVPGPTLVADPRSTRTRSLDCVNDLFTLTATLPPIDNALLTVSVPMAVSPGASVVPASKVTGP